MSNASTKTTTSKDFLILTSYKLYGDNVKGYFPIYTKSISQCCLDKNNKQKAIPIVIPKS
jgi:hypothetical protein